MTIRNDCLEEMAKMGECKWCKVKFRKKRASNIFCGESCRNSSFYYKKRGVSFEEIVRTAKCMWCEKEFEKKASHQIFCQESCFSIHRYYKKMGCEVLAEDKKISWENAKCMNCENRYDKKFSHHFFCCRKCQGYFYFKNFVKFKEKVARKIVKGSGSKIWKEHRLKLKKQLGNEYVHYMREAARERRERYRGIHQAKLIEKSNEKWKIEKKRSEPSTSHPWRSPFFRGNKETD